MDDEASFLCLLEAFFDFPSKLAMREQLFSEPANFNFFTDPKKGRVQNESNGKSALRL